MRARVPTERVPAEICTSSGAAQQSVPAEWRSPAEWCPADWMLVFAVKYTVEEWALSPPVFCLSFALSISLCSEVYAFYTSFSPRARGFTWARGTGEMQRTRGREAAGERDCGSRSALAMISGSHEPPFRCVGVTSRRDRALILWAETFRAEMAEGCKLKSDGSGDKSTRGQRIIYT